MSQAGLLTYSRFMSFPFRPTKQWMQHVMKRIKEFTAAGLSGTLTPFPFHPVGRLANRAPEQRQRYTFSFFRDWSGCKEGKPLHLLSIILL